MISLRNRTGGSVPCPTAEITLPAGLTVDRGALEEAGFSRTEIQAGRIHLYLEALGARQTVTLTVPVRAHRAGRFRTGAARVYPYYEPDRVTVRPDSLVVVRDGWRPGAGGGVPDQDYALCVTHIRYHVRRP